MSIMMQTRLPCQPLGMDSPSQGGNEGHVLAGVPICINGHSPAGGRHEASWLSPLTGVNATGVVECMDAAEDSVVHPGVHQPRAPACCASTAAQRGRAKQTKRACGEF